jgi:hypothetical protein
MGMEELAAVQMGHRAGNETGEAMRNAGLLAAAALLAATGRDITYRQRLRDAGEGTTRIRTPPKMDTELQREIAEHNRQVDYRKAEKRARKALQEKP